MNEETEVKAPVTRLRRRLSVEQSEDGKSSPALGTPTKKRGGRKAAKPELDLIHENAAEIDLKKTTKKTIAKEVAELESEKPVTPSRRSARIKSNTSIVSDTIQNVDSPRAKRAARRTSHVGSDTEMSVTPAKTRRTRKDSSSSIEKQVVATPTLTKAQIPEVITEEPDNSTKSTKDGSKVSDNESTTQTPIRKSPRLVQKKSRNSNSPTQDEGKNDSVESNNELIHTTESDKKDVEPDMKLESHIDANIIKEKNNTNSDKNRLSVSSCNLIRNLEDKPKKKYSDNNKSMIETQDSNKIKTKRHRTKSWTTITNVSSINQDFYSDNEIIKKKHQQKSGDNIKKQTFNSGSGDNMHNYDDEELNCSQNKIMSSGKKKKKETMSEKCVKESEVRNLFQKDPSENIQTTIVMEDSDSNPLQVNLSKNINEDQCVPVVDHQFENKDNEPPEFTLSASFNKDKNDSKVINPNDACEPMDVDETLPECLPNLSTKLPENQEKSLLHNTLEINNSIMNQTSNRSNRKSSTSLSMSQNLEKSNAENKSTLVLSQLKDLSNTENKSPKFSKKEQLSQSSNLLNITQENEKRKKISLNYLTSTPLQQKVDLGGSCKNKSNNIFDNNISKNKDKISPKKNMSEIDDRSEQISEAGSESDEELETSKTSNLLDDEAEEASDDYESGDSQDEDEKQYEKDNEIVEKGETLTSEDDLSDDSDYEKDSFVVTSDEEDNELLSGSGDDLSMSDNELTINPKSKKKYNDRKLKEQKQASREMYESRHKLNTSKKDHNSRSSKTGKKSHERLDSSSSDNSEDNIKFTKKNRRMRLDSTATDSINISKIENTDSRKKDMDMSVSSNNENVLEEKEITMNEEATGTISDPLAPNIKEENIIMKEQNISIDFVDTNVQKDNTSNTTTNSKSLETKNPLEGSDNESSSSLSTEDENIAQSYNDMLNDLKVKTANYSLNIEKKSKKKSSIPIVDHLNITQSKALKMTNKSLQKENTTANLKNDQNTNSTENWSVTNYVNQEADQDSSENADAANNTNNKHLKYGDCSLKLENKSQKKSKPSLVDQLNLTQGNKKSRKDKNEKTKSKKFNINEEQNKDDSSDSIDLKLLFSEDSINSSDLNKENFKKAEIDTESFIPLKKAEAKTDIRATKDNTYNDDAEQPFFIDTIGNQPSNSSDDEEIVNKKNTQNKRQEEKESSGDESNEEPLEISYKKEQNEEFVRKNKAKKENVDETDHGSTMSLADKSLLKAPQSEKKRKNSLSEDISQLEDISDKSLTINNKMKNTSVSFNVSSLDVFFSTENIIDSKNNKSNNKTPGSEKKKIKRLSERKDSDVELDNSEVALNKLISKTPQSEKKKNRLSLSENLTTFNSGDKPSDESLNKENSINESLAKTPGSGKKKTKTLSQSTDYYVNLSDTEPILNKSINKTPKSEKKKKKLSMSDNSECFDLVDKKPDESLNNQNKSIIKTPGSGKKKIKKSSESNGSDVELSTDVALNKSISKTPKSEKKKKISVSGNSECTNLADKTSDESIAKTPSSGQKKIKKLSQSNGSDGEVNNIEVDVNRSIGKTPNSEKKKKKLLESKNSEASDLADKISDKSGNEPIRETKKKISSQFNQVESEIEVNQNITQGATDGTPTNNGDITNAKKRRRSSSMHLHDAASGDDLSQTNAVENNLNASNKKKRKISQKSEENDKKDVSKPEGNAEINITQNNKPQKNKKPDIHVKTSQKAVTNKRSKEIRHPTTGDLEKTSDANFRNTHKDDNKSGNLKPKGDKNNKRKNRDDDNDTNEALKVRKENSFDHIHISRLPPSILNKLDDKPNKVEVAPKKKVISTTEFEVEETRKRRNKPSNYLEESIYINDDESIEEQKKKAIIKKPKVLPFVPTATTSNSGYTTKFKVNVIPHEIKFVAQSNNVNSYKNEYLYGTKIKRLGTYDLYKKNRNIKMSKF